MAGAGKEESKLVKASRDRLASFDCYADDI